LAVGSLSALGTLAVGILGTAEFAVITGQIAVLETEVGILQTEVDVLQEKPYFLSSDNLTQTTITSNLKIGSLGLTKATIYSQSGEINTLGKIKVNNQIVLDTDGSITSNSLNVGTGHIDAITTNNSSVQNINGSNIKIGLNGSSSIEIGNFTTPVYVNNVLLEPFSSASSFFNQW
jgi:hypothetical protein